MLQVDRLLDIELTNRCNALCTFCPRDRTPEQGVMTLGTLKHVIAKAEDMAEMPELNFTGQGESLLHPQLEELMRFVHSRGHSYGMTTNASRLTSATAEMLLATGMQRVTFSVSDFDDDYNEVYGLDFHNTLNNIKNFIPIAKGICDIRISIVEHDLNRNKIKTMRKFWKDLGIDKIFHFGQVNRAGACEQGHYFIDSRRFEDEAKQLLRNRNISSLCGTPFRYMFVGWNGNHYICCNDYEKRNPLGTIAEKGFYEMDDIKYQAMAKGLQACLDCDIDPVNKVREALFEQQELNDDSQIIKILDILEKDQSVYPDLFTDLDWEANAIEGNYVNTRPRVS